MDGAKSVKADWNGALSHYLEAVKCHQTMQNTMSGSDFCTLKEEI